MERWFDIKILSLDQSTKKTGWAIFVDHVFAGCGLIDYDDNTRPPADRFTLMCKAVRDLITRVEPDLVVLEDVAYQRNPATLIELARLQGMIIGTCQIGQIEFYIYPCSSWRAALGFQQGRGNRRPELKRQAQEYAKKTIGLELDEDTTDAVSIGSAFIISFCKEKSNG